MDTTRLANLLAKAYNEFRASHGVRSREVNYTRVLSICDGAAAVIGCASADVQAAIVDAEKSYRLDEAAGRDKRYKDDLNARLKELMV